MAEQTQQQAGIVNNGQRPTDEEMPNVQKQLINGWTSRELVDFTILQLSRTPYNAHILYQSVFQNRFAEIRRENPPLYFGELMQAVNISLSSARANTWDREIASLAQAQDELDIVPLSLVEPEEIIWLWYPYIPLKKLTLIEGDPASGKTYLILAIAAGITQGYDLPNQDGEVGKPSEDRKGTVLYITAEDGMADTIRPRAEKVGADLTRLFVLREPQAISLQEPQTLQNALARFRPKMLVLDPIQAFLGAGMDMHRANEVRPLMTTLLAMAIHYECAIICVRHWTKAVGGKAGHRGQGNVDFAAAARSQISVGESPHDAGKRIMAQAKMSLAGLGTSIVFSIEDKGLEWVGTSTITANELSQAQPNLQHHQRKDAMKWLKDFLTPTAQPSELTIHEAEKVSISEKTLRRAKEALGVLSTRIDNIWYWRLPTVQKWERYAGQEEEI
jgi:DNA repair protein RadA/Sms